MRLLCPSLKERKLCDVDIWEFIQKETSVLFGKRSKKVLCLPLKGIYDGSQIKGKNILLRNNRKEVAWWCPKTIDRGQVLFPRILQVTPTFILFASWAEGEFGESPLRNPQFSSSLHKDHNWVMESFEKSFHYPRNRFRIAVQYAQKVIDTFSNSDIDREIRLHCAKLEGISIDQIEVTSSGEKGKQSEKAPTLNTYYNPDLFEIVLSLCHSVVHVFPKIIEGEQVKPSWFVGDVSVLKEPIALVNSVKVAKDQYHLSQTMDGKIAIWKVRTHKIAVSRVNIPVNFQFLLWIAIMIAEGTKSKPEFLNADPDMLKIVLKGLNEIFDINTIDVHYDVLIGEVFHTKIHDFLKEPLESHLSTQTVPRCTNQNVINLVQKMLLGQSLPNKQSIDLKREIFGIPSELDISFFKIPELMKYRFYRLRVDRMGKKSNLRVELNFKGTASDFVWKIADGVFYDLDDFIRRYRS